ncbi:quinone oxidoreductase [Exophiala xenobiotica]|nr:quinone oxidoreductase [Exophiala xenobiotica]
MSNTSIPTKTRSWVLTNKPSGLPTISGDTPTFTLQPRDLPPLNNDQVLVKALYYSNDPAQRGWISPDIPAGRLYVPPVQVGDAMRTRGLCEVIDSKSPNLPKGTIVQCSPNWNEYAVLDSHTVTPVQPLPNGLSITHYLGALGGTGLTAYYGLVVICEAKRGDKVVVSGAAGATGSMVVQIAKHIVGAGNVIGIAGTDDKCRWVESLGADKCLNYKSPSFASDLEKATQDGVDIFFDNVGGEILDMMLGRMSMYGRVAACGAITSYNSSEPLVLKNYFQVITMRLQIKGFIVIDYLSKAAETQKIFRQAIQEGKLKVGDEMETVVSTKFDDVPKTWLKLFSGENTGKLVTKLEG